MGVFSCFFLFLRCTQKSSVAYRAIKKHLYLSISMQIWSNNVFVLTTSYIVIACTNIKSKRKYNQYYFSLHLHSFLFITTKCLFKRKWKKKQLCVLNYIYSGERTLVSFFYTISRILWWLLFFLLCSYYYLLLSHNFKSFASLWKRDKKN